MNRILLFIVTLALAAVVSASVIHTLRGSGQAVDGNGTTTNFKVNANQLGGSFSASMANSLGLSTNIVCSFLWDVTFDGDTATISGPAKRSFMGGPTEPGVLNATFTDGAADTICFTFTPDDTDLEVTSFEAKVRLGGITITP